MVSKNVLRQHLTQLSPQKLQTLEQCIKNLDKNQITGDFLECGNELDGSSLVLASLLSPSRHFCGYTTASDAGAPLGSEEKKLVHIFAMSGLRIDGRKISLQRGEPKAITTVQIGRPIALAHIVEHQPDSILTYLQALAPCVEPGGCIVVNHHGNFDVGQKTIDRFLENQSHFIRDANVRSSFLLQHILQQ
jgi:hypothetical protein